MASEGRLVGFLVYVQGGFVRVNAEKHGEAEGRLTFYDGDREVGVFNLAQIQGWVRTEYTE